MYNVTINGKEYQVEEGLSIIEACDSLDIKIPRFCYLKGLSIPANCRMCLVEVKGGRKLVPACHTPVTNDMVIFTESDAVQVARKNVMAFLLINHPLDCPICDEGGDCELQNQAVAYGFNDSSYEFGKRARDNKNLGPLISTSMNRCINCTRCIRFMDEVAGLPVLGIVGRGEQSDISNYFQEPINSELSGNLVDVCPVGALNNAQYLFRDRPWQLTSTNTIDILDSMGSSIIVNMEETEVVRILPQDNPSVNEAWLADKSRYICDAVDLQRIDTPWIKDGGKLKKSSFDEAFALIQSNIENLTGAEIAALSGRFADVESALLLKELMASLGSNLIDCRLNGVSFNQYDRNSYIFNSTIAGIEEADCILIVGSNPKKEVPVLNARIKKRLLAADIPIAAVGEDINLSYKVEHLGSSLTVLLDLLNGNNSFAKTLENAKKPMLIVGEGAFKEQDFNEVLALLYALCHKFNIVQEDWNGYNFIHTAIGNIGGLDIGFVNDKVNAADILNKASTREIKLVWLLNADELDFSKLQNSFVVYIGHHGDKGAENANVVLPAALWLEKDATFVNLEGRVLQTKIVKKPPQQAKEDWKIIKAFSDFINKPLPYNTLEDVRQKMVVVNPVFSDYNVVTKNITTTAIANPKQQNFKIKDIAASSTIKDYYLTDVISRNSSTMAKCSQLFNGNSPTLLIKTAKRNNENL